MPHLSEADTYRQYVVPALHAAGWDDDRIAEQYRTWQRNRKASINAELHDLFKSPPPGVAAMLDALLPGILDKTFKGAL